MREPFAEPFTPTTLAVDSAGRLYVHAAAGVIRLATADGRRLGVFTRETGVGVAVDPAGNVWTTQLTPLVQVLVKYGPGGAKLGELRSPDVAPGVAQTAKHVAVDSSGIIHVGESGAACTLQLHRARGRRRARTRSPRTREPATH